MTTKTLSQVPVAAEVIENKKSPPDLKIDMKYLVRALVRYNASDLHVKVGRPPLYRINGKLIAAKMAALSPEQMEAIVFSILTEKQKGVLEIKRQVDLSFRVTDLGRFRCNVYYQRDTLSAAVRMIPLTVPNIDQLHIPEVIKELSQRPRGLLLVTGSTGSGKSTTLAGIINYLNERKSQHILTIEDPIEFVHRDIKATVTQREVGSDVHSLAEGITGGLRQDPDVIMIGELRDCDMIQAAITAAETGHLVISTLHTNDAKGTIERVLDSFPSNAQNQIRVQLASVLVAVIWQQLLMRADGKGRVPACEVMVKSPAIESYIFKNEMEKIPELIAQSSDYYKMQSMNQALEKLIKSGMITQQEAVKASPNPDDLRLRMSGIARSEGYEMAASYEEEKTPEIEIADREKPKAS